MLTKAVGAKRGYCLCLNQICVSTTKGIFMGIRGSGYYTHTNLLHTRDAVERHLSVAASLSESSIAIYGIH